MLDEMTAALPADLTERVLEVIGRRRGTASSIIFISHRMIEIGAVCDRATVLREGETVGVVDVEPGSEERIVRLMLGDIEEDVTARPSRTGSPATAAERGTPRIRATSLGLATKLVDVSFDLYPGEVLGVVALEGQGQDELFDILAGSERPRTGELLVDGRPASFRHPADAIRAGLVYVPADRAEALLMQRSVRENIALPFTAPFRSWGPIDARAENRRVNGAVERLEIDTRAQGEVRRLSGGNQQKVTIARWVAGGVRTMLCFDPTRGIDIGTKRQIYALLRELAEAGAAVLLYTSELKEIQLACDRAIVIFNGRVVAEIPVEEADEPTLLRAAYDLPPDAAMPEEIAATELAAEGDAEPSTAGGDGMSAAATVVGGGSAAAPPGRASATTPPAGMRGRSVSSAVLAVMLAFTKIIQPNYGPAQIQGLAIGVLPVAFAAIAQAIIVISGRDRPVGRLDHVADGRHGGGPARRPGRRRGHPPRPRRPGAGARGRRHQRCRSSS